MRQSAFALTIALLLFWIPRAHAATLSITTPAAQTAVVGSNFSLQILASGGSGGNQFTLATGTLPAGLSLNQNTGSISGVPTASESRTVSITVTDNSSATATTSSFSITTGWTVTTYAGNGLSTTSGNGGQATSAGMQPHSLFVSQDGSVYFGDVTANSIRRINSSGVVTLITNTSGQPTGIAVKDNGDIYYSNWGMNAVVTKFTASNSSTATWSSGASLTYPRGFAFDSSGNLYVAAQSGNVVMKYLPDGTSSTYVGTGIGSSTGDGGAATSATINAPMDIAMDLNGNLFIAEFGSARIRKVTSAGIISTVLGDGASSYAGDGGLASSAKTTGAWGITTDGGGNIFFAERQSGTIRRIDAVTGIVTRVAGLGSAGTNGSPINGISSVATFGNLLMQIKFDQLGNLYVVDYQNNMIRRIANVGVPFTAQVSTVSLSTSGAIRKGVSQSVVANISVPGKVTFLANGKRIPRCISIISNAAGNVTCTWMPATSGSTTLSARLVPTDSLRAGSSVNLSVRVERRQTKR